MDNDRNTSDAHLVDGQVPASSAASQGFVEVVEVDKTNGAGGVNVAAAVSEADVVGVTGGVNAVDAADEPNEGGVAVQLLELPPHTVARKKVSAKLMRRRPLWEASSSYVPNFRYDSLPVSELHWAADLWVTYIMGEVWAEGICEPKELVGMNMSLNPDGTFNLYGRVPTQPDEDADAEAKQSYLNEMDSRAKLQQFKSVAWADFDHTIHIPKIDRTRRFNPNQFGLVYIGIGGSKRSLRNALDTAKRFGLSKRVVSRVPSSSYKKEILSVPLRDAMLWLDHVPTTSVVKGLG